MNSCEKNAKRLAVAGKLVTPPGHRSLLTHPVLDQRVKWIVGVWREPTSQNTLEGTSFEWERSAAAWRSERMDRTLFSFSMRSICATCVLIVAASTFETPTHQRTVHFRLARYNLCVKRPVGFGLCVFYQPAFRCPAVVCSTCFSFFLKIPDSIFHHSHGQSSSLYFLLVFKNLFLNKNV